VNGFCALRPRLPPAFHAAVVAAGTRAASTGSIHGNDLLEVVPALSGLFADPVVAGPPRIFIHQTLDP
jgi:hypothetical protein